MTVGKKHRYYTICHMQTSPRSPDLNKVGQNKRMDWKESNTMTGFQCPALIHLAHFNFNREQVKSSLISVKKYLSIHQEKSDPAFLSTIEWLTPNMEHESIKGHRFDNVPNKCTQTWCNLSLALCSLFPCGWRHPLPCFQQIYIIAYLTLT